MLTEMYPADTPDPLEEVCRQDLVLLLDRALGVLPENARQVVEMRHLLELPRSEVAARLGLSSGALETRLHRAGPAPDIACFGTVLKACLNK